MKTLFPSDDPCARGSLVLGVIIGFVVFMFNWAGSGFGAGISLGLMAAFLIWGVLRMFVCTGRQIQPGTVEVDQPLRRAAGWGDHVHNIFSHEPQGETRPRTETTSPLSADETVAQPVAVAGMAPVTPPVAVAAPVAAPVKAAAKVTTPSDLIDLRAGEEAAPAEDEKAVAATKAKPATKDAAEKTSAVKPAAKSKTRGKAAPKAGKAKPDDLKKIKGIGPVYEKMLHKLGYTTFEQVAGWTKADIDRMQEEMPGFDSRIESEDWIGQAAELAKGKGK